jgi:GH15 family glucan-1,4-alpha-glucosidase
VAVRGAEFDPEFESCGGYGYFWPRDGAEYVSGLIDAGYPEFAPKMFDWCARHQDQSGLWHQRYFLNGEPGPNWCLPPETLQIDQVGAVLWAYGKWRESLGSLFAQAAPVQGLETLAPDIRLLSASMGTREVHDEMIRRAADYLISRQDPKTGVHMNAFDTWETFIGSFTYSNAAIYAAFKTASSIFGDPKYAEAAQKMKEGVLTHFVRESPDGYRYLTRGFKADGSPDETVDSASLGAIDPFGLLDLEVLEELELAIGTLRAVTERLEVPWMNGRAIRRFEGDAYVGGVPACVNTLWMARCCLKIAEVTSDFTLVERAQGYLQVVLKRATPTLLLPELMQGPDGQNYWAAPHGWAMSSFVSGVLGWAKMQR